MGPFRCNADSILFQFLFQLGLKIGFIFMRFDLIEIMICLMLNMRKGLDNKEKQAVSPVFQLVEVRGVEPNPVVEKSLFDNGFEKVFQLLFQRCHFD